MEDKTPPSTTVPPPAARTADALRELHDRARTALAAQRERMGLLEAQLTKQLDSIADTLAEQIAVHGNQTGQNRPPTVDVERARRELENARATWIAERDQLTAEVANRARLLDERQAELDAEGAQLATGRSELDARQQTLDDRAIELNARERELRQRQELLDAYASQCAAQQSQLTATESALDKQRDNVAKREAAVQSSQQQLDNGHSALAAREQAFQKDQASLIKEREQLRAELAALQAERETLAARLDALPSPDEAAGAELKSQLADVERALQAKQTAWDRQRGSFEDQQRLLAKERDELTAALEAARGELAIAREKAGAAGERDELRQKFDLALEDVQRLRGRVAELEQELVSRPAPDQTDSVELVHLRAERDALAERIAELEQQPAAAVDADAAQEMADLQRRFELAVEDVRDLKKQNSQLEVQLANAKVHTTSASSTPNDGGNWEARKKQMLASLEGEGDDVEEEHQEERTTIESTIRITDEVVASKDQEIAELKARLAESASVEPEQTQAVRELVDADAVIQEHRARIAELEREMQEKLRAAELELSVERARIAREKAQLADSRAEIDSLRSMNEAAGGAGGQPPKRRWLSKLGLSGEEE